MRSNRDGVHWSFWVIGAVALVWNLMGSINFLIQMNPEMVAHYPESEQAIINDRPAWATGGFAIAVFGGTVGALLLLLRKSAAFHLFIASLLGVIVTMIHTGGVAFTFKFSALEMAGFILMPLLVAGFLVWYSKYSEIKDWVR